MQWLKLRLLVVNCMHAEMQECIAVQVIVDR